MVYTIKFFAFLQILHTIQDTSVYIYIYIYIYVCVCVNSNDTKYASKYRFIRVVLKNTGLIYRKKLEHEKSEDIYAEVNLVTALVPSATA